MAQEYSFESEAAEAAEFEKEIEKELGNDGVVIDESEKPEGNAGEKTGEEIQDGVGTEGDDGGGEKRSVDGNASENIVA